MSKRTECTFSGDCDKREVWPGIATQCHSAEPCEWAREVECRHLYAGDDPACLLCEHVRAVAPVAGLVAALTEVRALMAVGDAWWCPSCGETDCTFSGNCTGCGQHIEDSQPSRELRDRIDLALAAAESGGAG